MIVLDTNVVSEVMRARPDARALRWLDAQSADDLWVTSITVAELLHGIARLPTGRRRRALAQAASEMLTDDLGGRCLDFDARAAVAYAALCAARERSGKPIHMADAQIAAICELHGAALATRNRRDFTGLQITLIDPWAAPASD